MENNYLVFDSGYRGDCKTEAAEQTDLAAWIDFNLPWVIWFHVPNEGKRLLSGVINKNMGVKKGVADIIILSQGYLHDCGVIELKRKDKKKSKVSEDQKQFLSRCQSQGIFSALTYGKDEAVKAIKIYFTGSDDNDKFALYVSEQRKQRRIK